VLHPTSAGTSYTFCLEIFASSARARASAASRALVTPHHSGQILQEVAGIDSFSSRSANTWSVGDSLRVGVSTVDRQPADCYSQVLAIGTPAEMTWALFIFIIIRSMNHELSGASDNIPDHRPVVMPERCDHIETDFRQHNSSAPSMFCCDVSRRWQPTPRRVYIGGSSGIAE
jgi:hypothetical protein